MLIYWAIQSGLDMLSGAFNEYPNIECANARIHNIDRKKSKKKVSVSEGSYYGGD